MMIVKYAIGTVLLNLLSWRLQYAKGDMSRPQMNPYTRTNIIVNGWTNIGRNIRPLPVAA
jgi:hypothetical protein